jgi:hypothetical protein
MSVSMMTAYLGKVFVEEALRDVDKGIWGHNKVPACCVPQVGRMDVGHCAYCYSDVFEFDDWDGGVLHCEVVKKVRESARDMASVIGKEFMTTERVGIENAPNLDNGGRMLCLRVRVKP